MPTAPTIYLDNPGSWAAEKVLEMIYARGWKGLVMKPVPSTWSEGILIIDLPAKGKKGFDSWTLKQVAGYLKKQATAKRVLAQEWIEGLDKYPETRVYWLGDEFKYAVANIKDGKVTTQPDTSTDSGLAASLVDPAKLVAEQVKAKVLPQLKAFDGTPLKGWPWFFRIDVGKSTKPIRDLEKKDGWVHGPGKQMHFLNEVEIAPTLYLHKRLKHNTEWLPIYAKLFVELSAKICSRDAAKAAKRV